MSGVEYRVGMPMWSPKTPQWGIGKVVHINGRRMTVDFCNLGTKTFDTKVAHLDVVLLDESEAVGPRFGSTGPALLNDINFFAKPPKIFFFKELQEEDILPRMPGVYGWYFKKRLPFVPVKDCPPKSGKYKRWKLLYIGLGNNMRSRILNMHFGGDADCSSLRLSLGCLLSRKRNLFLWKIPTSKEGEYRYTFGDKGEVDLSKWMASNARVAFRESGDYKALEKAAISRYCPPLNTEDNPRPFAPLKFLKNDMRACALPRGSKPPKKAVKNAYKKFVKECKAR